MLTTLIGLLLISTLNAVAAASLPAGLTLDAQLRQGQLVIGHTAPGTRISIDARNLRVDARGRFVFGIGRDQTRVALCIRQREDTKARCAGLPVQPRKYAIERVTGLPQSTVTPNPEEQARIAREAALITNARTRDDARSDFASGFVRPAPGRFSGVYGSQRVLNGEARSPHMGLDIAGGAGTAVRAPAAGIVTLVHADMLLTGQSVILDHGHGVSSVFIHMSRTDVREGQRLAQGDPIGAIGMTGRASGPHLHWGMNWFDIKVDPALVLVLK